MNLAELRTALKERREDYSPSDAKLNRKINQAYLDICSRRQWGWLRREFTGNTYASTVITGSAAANITATNGSNQISIHASLVPGPTVLGKRILIGDSFYTITDTDSFGTTLFLDRIYTGTTLPDVTVTPTDYGSVTIVYEDVALPLGAKAVVEAALFSGASSYPLSLEGIKPASMALRDKNVYGRPTKCSVIEKKPIYSPRKAVSDFGSLTPAAGAGLLTSGATYKYWYSFVDKKSGAESALSASSSVALGLTDNQVTLPNVTARKDYILRIYRSTANGSVPFLVRDRLEEALAGYVDGEGDDYLGPQGPESASTLFLNLYPAPDSNYQVHTVYQSEALSLDNDNDRPLFDSSYSGVLLDGAEYLMLTSSDEQGRAASVRGSYETGIRRMISQDRLNYKEHVLIGRGMRRLRGKKTWWYGSLGS